MKRIAIAGLLIASPASAQYIDGLPPATSVTSSDLLPLCQSGVSGRPGTCKPHSATVGSLGSAVSITANGVTQSAAQWMANLHVPNVAALRNLSATGSAQTGGYTTDGDGGGALYQWSAASTATDDGCGTIAVAGVATGRWRLVMPAGVLTPKQCGAVGDGTAADDAAIQTALNVAAGNTLFTGPYTYKLNTGVTVPANTQVICSGNVGRSLTRASFTAGATNITMLTLGSDDYLGHCSLNPGHAGTSTSGAAVFVPAGGLDVLIEDVYIQGGYLQADINGNTIRIKDSFLNGATGGGIRVGHLTTAGSTVDPRITNVTVATLASAAYDLRVEDAGGLLLTGDDFLFAGYGTWIIPGLNQAVEWTTATGTYLADTNATEGLLIDTADATAVVKGMTVTGSWTSNAQTGSDIHIKNTAAGSVSGLHFIGQRIYSSSGNSVQIDAGSNITFDAASICGAGSSTTDIAIASGVSYGAVRNSTLGGACDNWATQTLYGISFGGSNSQWVVTGNNFVGSNPTNGLPSGKSVFNDNIPLDANVASVASASSITLGTAWSQWGVTGTSTISTINGAWTSRSVMLYPQAAFSLTTGGNVCTAATATVGVPLLLRYDGTCWRVK